MLEILAGFYSLEDQAPRRPQHALRRASSWLQEQHGNGLPL